jgi:hypothetical protein
MQQRESHIAIAHARVPKELRLELGRLAQANDRSVAAEIRTAIREHVQREQAAAPTAERSE